MGDITPAVKPSGIRVAAVFPAAKVEKDVTSVTSDFRGCNDPVTSSNDKKRQETTSETAATKALQEAVTSVTPIDIERRS